MMRAQLKQTIAYSSEARVYGIRTSNIGTPAVPISRCPWCGSNLPPTQEAAAG
jgi:hypothetical protein